MENDSGSKQREPVPAESSAEGTGPALGEGEVVQTPERKTRTEEGKNASHDQLPNDRGQKERTGKLKRRGPTGPRTRRGKRKSRYNAAKHGALTDALLPSESREEYYAHVNGFVDSLQLVGDLEEELVENLAMLFWRRRRLLRAESAEITRWGVARETDPEISPSRAVMLEGGLGLISTAMFTKDEVALRNAVCQLKELRERIRQKGLDWGRDQEALKSVFGTEQRRQRGQAAQQSGGSKEEGDLEPSGDFAKAYREIGEKLRRDSRPDSSQAYSAGEAKVLADHLTKLIELLEPMLRRWLSRKEEERKLGETAALVPPPRVADNLRRYEGMFERNIDRTLNQIERLQRMRLGHAVPPPVKVELSR